MSDFLPNPSSPHRPIQSYVFGVIFILLFLVVCRLFTPFFSALLWSILLYILFSPLHRRFIKNLNFDTRKGRILRSFWAIVFTLGTMAVIFIPLSLMGTIFFRQIMDIGRYARETLNQRPESLHELFEKISAFIHDTSAGQIIISSEDINNQLKALITNELLGNRQMVFLSGNIVRIIGTLAINMLVMVFSLFFFFADGPYLSRLLLRAIPIRAEYISTLTKKFMEITRNLFLGYIIVALLQAVVAFFIFTIFKINGSLVLAVVTFLFVFIPVLGATVVYIPLAVLKIASGNIVGGVVFFIVSAVFISGIDNILRPFFLRDRIQLHPLIIFFAILGGLAVFGFNGFILGPVLVILFLTVLDLFLTEHKIGAQDQG
ncbi:MAG: AI-2E family transporter [Treponema sp.]|jgi:predicted PurR-regulated permease PerM|nr:AI-2E family transporter [Treponema sp.]